MVVVPLVKMTSGEFDPWSDMRRPAGWSCQRLHRTNRRDAGQRSKRGEDFVWAMGLNKAEEPEKVPMNWQGISGRG